MGTAVVRYVMWVVCGLLGSSIGPLLGDVSRFGFGMAFPAVFLVLVRGMWRGFQAAKPWLILVVAIIVYAIAPNGGLYVPAGTLAGLLFAYFANGDAK